MTECEQTEPLLTCTECAAAAPPGARSWRALLSVGNEDAEDAEEVAV